MDRDTLKNLLIAGFIFVLVMAVAPKLMGPPPQPGTQDQGNTGGVTTTAPGAKQEAPSSILPTGSPNETPSTVAASGETDIAARFSAIETQSEQTRHLGSAPIREKDDPTDPYRMGLTLSNIGASITSATATDHAETLKSKERYTLLAPIELEDGRTFRSLAMEGINIDGFDIPLHDKKWQVGEVVDVTRKTSQGETQTGQELVFHLDIQESGSPALRVTRTFFLPQQDTKQRRHDLNIDLRVDNLSKKPERVVLSYRGGLGVRRAAERMPDQYLDCGIFDGTRVNGDRKTFAETTGRPADPPVLFKPSSERSHERVSWAATANTYFTCTIAPQTPDGHDNPNNIARVTAIDVDGSELTTEDATLRFVFKPATIGPGESLILPASIYLGEKDGDAFKGIETYRERNYYYQISQSFGWCTFIWLVELMIWLLNALSFVCRDYGVAIIILVLIVRTLLHPITKKGQINMVRMQHKMQDLAPKIEEIKKKYANDKARLNQEMMKLNINPAGQIFTCLPMMIQMPIWIALFLSLSNNIGMRHEAAFYGVLWIDDMTAQDALYTFSAPLVIPLLGWQIESFNLLPILVSVFMYTQQKLQPKPKPNPNQSDQQRQQQEMMQKMMPMMSIMMLLIFYKMPSGLNLYIMASSLFGTIEQFRIRKHIKEQEEAGTLHKPHKTRELPSDDKGDRKQSFFQKMQKMAEEAQKPQTRRPAKGKGQR